MVGAGVLRTVRDGARFHSRRLAPSLKTRQLFFRLSMAPLPCFVVMGWNGVEYLIDLASGARYRMTRTRMRETMGGILHLADPSFCGCKTCITLLYQPPP